MRLNLVVAKAKGGSCLEENSFQDPFDKRGLDNCAKHLWTEIFHGRQFYLLWVLRKTGKLESLSILGVPTGLMFKCQEWKSWSLEQKSPQWATANTYQPLIRSSSPSVCCIHKRTQNVVAKSFRLWRSLGEAWGSGSGWGLCQMETNLDLGKEKLDSKSWLQWGEHSASENQIGKGFPFIRKGRQD